MKIKQHAHIWSCLFFLAFSLVVSVRPNCAHVVSADSGEFKASLQTDSSMNQGSYHYAYVRLNNVTNVASLDITVHFDSSIVSVQNTYSQCDSLIHDKAIKTDSVSYSYIFDTSTEQSLYSLFYFYYNIKSSAPVGSNFFDVTVDGAYDTSLNPIDISGSRFSFEVKQYHTQIYAYMYGTYSISTSVEQQFTLSYSFSTYEIASGSLEINYDRDHFELVSITPLNFLDGKMVDINTSQKGCAYISFIGLEYKYGYNLLSATFKTKINETSSSKISLKVSDLYNSNLDQYTCSGYTTTVYTTYDSHYDEKVPTMGVYSNLDLDTNKVTSVVKLSKNSNLGAGDFVISWDKEYLSFAGFNKNFSPSFFNVNDKLTDTGILKFSIISLTNIVNASDVITLSFDVINHHDEISKTISISGSGVSDSLTNKISLNYIGSTVVISGVCNFSEWTVVKDASCLEDGYEHRVCSVCQKEEQRVIPMHGHHYLDEWTIDVNPSCSKEGSKSHHCEYCGDKVDITPVAKLPHTPSQAVKENINTATCEKDGSYDSVIYCSICKAEISRESIVIPHTGHHFGDVSYKWDDKHSSCTASHTCECGYIEAEKVSSSVTKVDPKCLEDGKITYTVSFENPDFETQSFVETLPQTGHHYGEVTYSWNLDHSECTASHTCTCGHIESETAYSTNVRVEPECEKAGSITYTANFDNVNFETQTYLEVLPQTGHHYGEVTYSWNDDYSECTASYTCACGYINKEIVSTTNVKVDPKCLEEGKITYTASFENPDFETQTFVETLPQTGHHYGEVTYSWNSDHSECTASHTCTCGHIESETAYSTNVRVEQECEKDGSITYTANFDNVNFKTQTYIETLPQTGHHYGEVNYTWNDDHSTCTALHTCACGHIESETAYSTNVRVEPICETDGSITYTASFDNEDFDEQKFVEIIPQTGHTYNDISFSWNDDYSECTATMKCSCGHINKVTVKTTINRVEPKCVEDGSITYVASFDDERLEEQKHIETLPQTGHHYGEVTYTWNDEFSTCTASHKCECGHVESETVNTTNERIEPKCLEDGLVTYTAIFVNEKFVQQSHEIAIPQTGHHYGEPVYSWNDNHLECIARKTCNCGENIEEIAKINIAEVKPNCQKAGSITISAIFETAGFFEQVYVIELPKLEHEQGEVVIENYLDSSCLNPGSYDEVVYCKLCGEELSRITKTIEKKSHTFGEWFTINEPTYFEVGQERRDCLDCDEYEVRDIKKLDISILFKEQVSSIDMANDSLDELFIKIKEALATYECVDDKAKVVDEYETLVAYKNTYLNLVENINSEYEDAKNIERNFFVGIGILASMISLSKVMYIFRKRWF